MMHNGTLSHMNMATQSSTNVVETVNTTAGTSNPFTVFLKDPEKYFYDPASIPILTIAMPIILGMGVICNSAFIYVVIKLKHMHNATNYYLVNLAIADLIYLHIVVIDKVLRYGISPFAKDYGPWGHRPCKILSAFIFLPHLVSEGTIMLFTYERCRALRSTGAIYRQSNKRCLVYIIITWFIAMFALIPCIYFIDGASFTLNWIQDTITHQYTIRKCGLAPISFFGSLTIQCNGLQTIPFIFIAFAIIGLNVLILKALHSSAKLSNKYLKNRTKSNSKRQIALMLIATSSVFYLTLLPYYLDDILYGLNKVGLIPFIKLPKVWIQTGRFMAYFNSAINMLIYNIFSRRYRNAFKEAFCCCLIGKTTHTYSSSSRNSAPNVHENGARMAPMNSDIVHMGGSNTASIDGETICTLNDTSRRARASDKIQEFTIDTYI
ncbi:unnamed protein product [Owenia fusiformis]|uniref:G-protein coupled receptors family 1 profile domain-containing protein n=1 Tax=Owenia fusiformis TaxID=6347 RepID=A0A8S4NNE1_OWEFU|nr:unnamed protein product [Owenia fusiformis]